MTDWRGSGEAVRERWRQCFSEYASQLAGNDGCGPEIILKDIPVAWLANGFLVEPSRFTFEEYRKWLKSLPRRPFDEPKNGRPMGGSRAAATVACHFYHDWRGENQRREIRDYGHRGEMMDYAARSVVEDFYAWRFGAGIKPYYLLEIGSPKDVESFIEVVRALMDKPKARRHPGDDATVEFLVSRQGGLILELPPKPIQ
jgi:hypothetical protein